MLKLNEITLIDDAGLVGASFETSIENDDTDTANVARLTVRFAVTPSASLQEIKALAVERARSFIANLAEY